MPPDAAARTTPLARIVQAVEGHGQTLTLYNVTAPSSVVETIAAHFEVTTVSVERGRTDDGRPENFAVLRQGETFLAACGLERLRDAVDPAGHLLEAERPSMAYPELLSKVDQSVFTAYGKDRMILASREIEKRAWRARPAELHVGFQEFRRLRTQVDLYRRLVEDVTVHLYGVPDWEPPIEDLRLHGYPADELERHWFVVYVPGADPNDPDPRALLATERSDNVYSGFWTGRGAIVSEVLQRLEAEFPENDPFDG